MLIDDFDDDADEDDDDDGGEMMMMVTMIILNPNQSSVRLMYTTGNIFGSTVTLPSVTL